MKKNEINYIVNNNGYILIYYNNSISFNKNKTRIIVHDDKYYYELTLDCIIKRKNNSYIHAKNPFSSYNINVYLKENNINVKLITNDYVNSRTKMEWKCLCGNHFFRDWHSVYNQNAIMCKKCGIKSRKEKRMLQDCDIISKVKKLGYDIVGDINYNNNNTKITLKDSNNYFYNTSLHSLLHHKSTSRFSVYNRFTINNIKNYLFLNNIQATLISNNYTGRQNNLEWKCMCENIFEKSWNEIQSGNIFCETCSKSKSSLEIKTEHYLQENNLKYSTQYSFDNLRYKQKLLFDFAININDKLLLIECDGEQHYKENNLYHSRDSFQTTIIKDKIKDDYCNDNNIPLLRISYNLFKKEEYKTLIKNYIQTNS